MSRISIAAAAATALLCFTAPAVAGGCISGPNPFFGFSLTSKPCQAVAFGAHSTAIGHTASAAGQYATALGYFAGSVLDAVPGATSLGAFATGPGRYGVSVGAGSSGAASAYSGGDYSVAIGGGDGAKFSPAGHDTAIKLLGAFADGARSTAVGVAAEATGTGSAAVGLYSRASGKDAASYGSFSTAAGAQSVALGNFSEATGAASVALGASAVASVDNIVSVGSDTLKRRIVNVAPGTQLSDAVTVAQLQSARSSASDMLGEIRRELSALRDTVARQQSMIERQAEEIAALHARMTAPVP